MAAKSYKIEITAALHSVSPMRSDGKYRFKVVDRAAGVGYTFLLTKEKALKLANADSEFPNGVNLRLSGRISPPSSWALKSKSLATKPPTNLLFVKILAVDGHDVQSWAERHGSPEVSPEVLSRAQKHLKKADLKKAEEAAMRHRAPPEPEPTFKNPKEAYEKAMYILRRQVRLKEPKLSKTEIWALRDALNMLKEDTEARQRMIESAVGTDMVGKVLPGGTGRM